MERSFVPNDLHLASNSEDDGSTWLITGPNMGGKSTFLRQNAHIMLLAQVLQFLNLYVLHLSDWCIRSCTICKYWPRRSAV